MVISIIQPCFIPWLGYFEQMAVADVFVYLDDVKYTKQDWRNNNQLKAPDGVRKVTVPVRKVTEGTLIKDVEIAPGKWGKKMLNQIQEWYQKAPYYADVYPILEQGISSDYSKLVDLNFFLNQQMASFLGINTPVFRSSEIINNSSNKVERLLEICKHFKHVDTLFDGKSASNFLTSDIYADHGVKVIFQDYLHKPYPQLWGEYVPYMSAIDLMMNCGPEAQKYVVTSEL